VGSSPYELLGLAPSAGDEEVRSTWLKLLKELHPDKLPRELSDTARKIIESRTKEINCAYEEICSLRGGLKNSNSN
jgi:preprotein translocase subunit Sec63